MRATGPSIAIIQHLKSLGIKIRLPKKIPSPDSQRKTPSEALFGVALHSLPLCKKGDTPQFVVDICQFLSHHLGTEGLFRKSGSVNRIKTLKAQLESGETSFTTAQPSDVAALLKQFFRELPYPLIPLELQDPLCQIQESVGKQDRELATTLVTCLLPPVQAATLRYFCTFLQDVASRCDENKMDSGNLAVVLAPNLFNNSGIGEKMTTNTEKQLHLQTAAMQTLIEQAQNIGHLPFFILEKFPLSLDGAEDESVTSSVGMLRRRRRRSMGGLVNDALNKLKSGRTAFTANSDRTTDEIDQPLRSKTKRKASEETGGGETFSAKKRKSLRDVADEDLQIEDPSDPNTFFSPCRDGLLGADVFPEVSSCPSTFLEMKTRSLDIPSTPKCSRAQRTKNFRKENKRMSRVNSGLICVSPVQMERKEKVRNSLRLFQRSRVAKQVTSEGKTTEQSSWNLMKKMVAEALDGPIFNGKDLRVAPFSVKAVDQVAPVVIGDSSSFCPSSPSSINSSPGWKSKLRGRVEAVSPASGNKRRALRRSLSMPENLRENSSAEGECVLTGQSEETISSTTEVGVHMGVEDQAKDITVMEAAQIELCPLGCTSASEEHVTDMEKTSSLSQSQTSLCEISPSPPPFRRSDAHAAQFRSVRKLVLSFPLAGQHHNGDPEMKDWEKLATHTLKRKGARRFGRSLSHESGLSAEGEQRNKEQGRQQPSGSPTKTLKNRGRQVFISRKNITLSNWAQRSLETEKSVSLDIESSDIVLSPNWDPSPIRQIVEGEISRCRGSPKYPLSRIHLETIVDSVDL